MAENIFEIAGCIENNEYKGLYTHKNLPFDMTGHDGFLGLYIALEYRVDEEKIPLTLENLTNLINAFNPTTEETNG